MKKLLLVLLSALFLTSCQAGDVPESSDKLQVYTSFYTMYDFARLIGGDKADIHIMCPVGQEPHDFEPTPKDIATLNEADVFIYNGLGMEHWVDSVTDTLDTTKLICVNTSEGVELPEQVSDPHIWLNPDNAYLQMKAIADALSEASPENADYFATQLADCKQKIENLDTMYKDALSGLENRDIVVSHMAYGHLCQAFGLHQTAINGIDNGEEPSPAKMAEIINMIKDKGIKYIFTEPLGTSEVVETVAKESGCEILLLDPMEGNSEGKDYFTVMTENLDALKTALTPKGAES